MLTMPARNHVLIVPQIYVPLEPQGGPDTPEAHPRRAEIPMTWIQDDFGFRLDIDLPDSSALDLVFAAPVSSLHVNGETIWAEQMAHPIGLRGVHVENTPRGLRLTCTAAGRLHVLARGVAPAPRDELQHRQEGSV